MMQKNKLDRIILNKEYGEFTIKNLKKETIGIMKFDLDDLDFVKSSCWVMKSGGYAGNKDGRFHRLLLKPPKEMCVDHINRDKLDNRRSNLRICTARENICNQGGKGVYFDKSCNRWRSYISNLGKDIHLGVHLRYEDAIKKRKEAEIKYFGDFRTK